MSLARLLGRRPAPDAPPPEPPPPSFVCRMCRTSGSIYVAREVVNWNKIGEVFRRPDGALAYRSYNVYLPGEPGPPLRWACTNCNTYADSLDELIEGDAEVLLERTVSA